MPQQISGINLKDKSVQTSHTHRNIPSGECAHTHTHLMGYASFPGPFS